MSQNPTEDLLVVMLDLEAAGATDEIKSRALAAMTRIGWTPNDSTEAWNLSLASAEIRYNSWGQPVLSASGRSMALRLEAAQTRLPPQIHHPLPPQTPWEFFEASFEPFRRVAV